MRRSIWGISLIAASALTPLVRADTLLHRQAPGHSFGITSDTAYLDDFGILRGALVADHFSIGTDASVCRVNAYVFFGGELPMLDPPPPATESIRIRFYSDADGLPGDPLQETTLLNPAHPWTGKYIALGPLRKEYLYELLLPQCFPVQGGIPYWIEISEISDPNSRFRWENSNTAGEFASQFPIGSPWRITTGSGQMAYELWTPEPCSGALLALGVAAISGRAEVWPIARYLRGRNCV